MLNKIESWIEQTSDKLQFSYTIINYVDTMPNGWLYFKKTYEQTVNLFMNFHTVCSY